MERIYYAGKSYLTHFQLYYCCWFAPVRVGLLIIGYLNIIIDLVCLMGIANGSSAPTIMTVQDTLIEDNVSTVAPIVAYAVELGFNVVLLCALYRKDLVLMRVFLYYTILAVVLSFLTYSMVLAAVPLQIELAIVFSTLFQIYCIVLVRSQMVDMKMERKKYELPQLVLSSNLSDYSYPKKEHLHEVTITEAPKPQEVQITVVGQDEITKYSQNEMTKYSKDIEYKKDIKDYKVKKGLQDIDLKKDAKAEAKVMAKVKIEPDVKNVEVKKDAEVKVDIDTKENKGENSKDEKTKEAKLSKEEKKKEEKRIKEEKKKEEKRIKEEKKLEEKKSKEEKKNKETKIDKEETIDKEEKKDKEEQEKTKDSKKDIKEKWLETVTENPKE